MTAGGSSRGPARATIAGMVALALAGPRAVAAQTLAVGPQIVLADYRETARDLRFHGAGFAGAVSIAWRKLSGDVVYTRLSLDPAEGGDAVEGFTATQFDARLRYALAGPVSAEIGLTSRAVSPAFAAQEAGAARVGVRLSQLVDPAVRLTLRGSYLAAAKFSGGGSAPFGLELGLGVSSDFARRRLRLSADYEFQYFGRRTDDGTGAVSVPIQQSLFRLGAAGAF